MSVTASKDTDSSEAPSPSEGSDESAEKDNLVVDTDTDLDKSATEDVIVFGTDFNLPGSLMPVFILSSAFFNEIL
jgi:hypothetical protein